MFFTVTHLVAYVLSRSVAESVVIRLFSGLKLRKQLDPYFMYFKIPFTERNQSDLLRYTYKVDDKYLNGHRLDNIFVNRFFFFLISYYLRLYNVVTD